MISLVRPTTSVIISTRGRPELIVDAVNSILAGQQLPSEIVVVDQSEQPNKTLAGRNLRDGCAIVYLHRPGRGLSRGRNQGIRASTSDNLIFTDDDVLVDREWMSAIVDGLEAENGNGAVTGRVLTAAESGDRSAPSTITDERPARYTGRLNKDVFYTGNAAVPKAMFDAVGFFDEELGPGAHFPSAEDNDMGYRILRAGYSIAYCPDAVVYHRPWRSSASLMILRWRYGRGQGAFFAKHAAVGDRHMLRRFRRAIGRRLLGTPDRFRHSPLVAIGQLVYVYGTIAGFIEYWALHRESRRQESDVR